MAFGRRRRKTTTITSVSIKKPKTYPVDDLVYKTKAIATLHETLKEDPLVESFELPTVQQENASSYSKLGAKKCWINGIKFDSLLEGRYYVMLLHLIEDGEVKSYERQVAFVLQDKFRDKFSGKMIPAIKYVADFVLTLPDGTQVVIDVKGKETPDFKLKQKMFCYQHRDVQFMCVQWSEKDKEWQDLEDIKKAAKERKKAKKLAEASKEIA